MNNNKSGKNSVVSRRSFVGGAGALALSAVASRAIGVTSLSGSDAVAIAEGRREELIDLLSELIKIRSQSGETAEAAQKLVKSYLSNLPYGLEESADRPSEYVDHPEYMEPNPPSDGPFVNVVGWPKNAAESRFALFSHIDTHIVEDGWSTDPYEPKISNGRLYGLGASDDKGGVAAMLVAAAGLRTRTANHPTRS